MVNNIIEQEPTEILVYHFVGHNVDDPFAIAVYYCKAQTEWLELGHISCSNVCLIIVDGYITLLERSLGSGIDVML